MGRFKKYKGGYVDTVTGEIHEAGATFLPQVHKGFRIYEHPLSDIARERPLSGESARIFLYLLGAVEDDNTIPGPSAIARTLELKQPAVSRAYHELLDNGYLVKFQENYRIHPFICYSGSEAQREADLTKILVNSVNKE